MDWQNWLERWHRQQELYLPQRTLRFEIMLDYIARQRGSRDGTLRLLDLCCGPGSISELALGRFPHATVLAVDKDPWLLEMGRQTIGRRYSERLTFREADVRGDEWAADLAPGSFDAVFSATAIHWLWPEELPALYRNLAKLLAEGGLYLNADHLPVGEPRLDALSKSEMEHWQQGNFDRPGAENWQDYWENARNEPELAALMAARAAAFAGRTIPPSLRVDFHKAALRAAGFAEAGEIWRYYNDAILVAIL
jgi:SAM-dependent methyltransferase